jgi:protein-disulfide isomerase
MPWLLVLRLAALVALAASAALLSDYWADAPSFCSATSGCGAVRASQFSHLRLGDGHFVPLPLLGLLGFWLLFGASMLSRLAALAFAGIGGAIGLWLLSVQAFELRVFCWLCVTTDLAAIAAAASAFGATKADALDVTSRLKPWAWWGLAALVTTAPLVWPMVKTAPALPAGVVHYYLPGKLNVVEFADFQCPACRRFHGTLDPIVKRYGERVHFVRLMKPLASHEYARDAARASVCSEPEGKLEAMADALFTSQDLTPTGIDQLAKAVGLDESKFASCMASAATEERVARESALLVPPELEGLPTTYIGGKRLLGTVDAAAVEDALEGAARGSGEGLSGISGVVYLPLVALLGLLVVRLGRRRSWLS